MTKEKIKKFWNEHKDVIIAGTTLVVSGVVLGVACKAGISEIKRLENLKNTSVEVSDILDDRAIKLLRTVDAMKEGCTHYAPITLNDIIDCVGGEEGKRMYVDPDGRQLLVTNLIAFGTEVPTC